MSQPETPKPEILSNSRFSIPKVSAAPKAEPTPKYRQEISNYADVEETVDKALEWVSNSFKYCKDQPKRERSDTIRKIADEMWRVAKTRTNLDSDESDNVEDTRADYPSVNYFETIKTITAGETAVILGNTEELPMEYQPLPGTDGYLEQEGLRVAEDQNTVLAWAMEKKDEAGNDMYDAIRKALFYTNKYGNQVIEMDWDYRIDERWVPEFTYEAPEQDEQGNDIIEEVPKLKSRKFVKKKVTIANNPKMNIHDMADCIFDVDIPDVQNQNFFDIRKDMQLCDLYQLQRSGLLMNTGKISGGQFNGERPDEVEDRESNRGGSGTIDNQTNLLEVHKTRIRLPINDETGKWDEDNEIPHWFETWWSGDIESGQAVCLAIMPNPHHCKKIPVEIIHAFEDDNGALHLGNPELLKSGYSMLTTIINQYFDNVTARNQLPLIVERGAIGKRFTTVMPGGNRIIFKEPGFADPIPLEIKDTTAQTFPAMEKAEELQRRAAGINKPLLGEGLGSRASASEAINTLNQALKPALEDAKYKSDQMLPFMAFWIMATTRQFSDPNQQISVKFRGVAKKVFPGRLYGEQVVRVVAIKKMQDSILRVQQNELMLSQFLPSFSQYMSLEGITNLGKQIAQSADFDETDTWWKIEDDYDARHVALSESDAILIGGITDFAKPHENHTTHIKVHKDFLAGYVFKVPSESQDREGMTNLKGHIGQHEELQAEAEAKTAQTAQPIDEGQARTSGEGAGDTIAGGFGGLGTPATPDTGRPPEAL